MKLFGIVAGLLLMTGVASADEHFDGWFNTDLSAASTSSVCEMRHAPSAEYSLDNGASSGWFEEYESSWTWMFE